MKYWFFYLSILIVCILLFICCLIKPLRLRHVLSGIAAFGFSLLFDCFFGELLGYYHYISKSQSMLYIILSSLFLYPELDVIYLLFLPKKLKAASVYTAVWLMAMVIFELASLKAGTVVFTGWKLLPWSIITYLVTFLWLNCYFRYLEEKKL